MFKLGRKDIRPKVMEMTIKYSKEAEEHDIDEHDGGSKKVATKEGNKRNEMENKKESLTTRGKESKNKDHGKQKEVKELHKQIEEIKVKVNENKSNEQKKAVVMDNIERKDKSKKENEEVENESGKDDTSSRNVPSVDDESQLGSSQSRNDASTNSATNSEKEKQDMEQVPNENKDDASVLEDEPYRSGNIAG
nr:hypothetical protein CTI12_AA090750 [Tanacetum cinerariifolium]